MWLLRERSLLLLVGLFVTFGVSEVCSVGSVSAFANTPVVVSLGDSYISGEGGRWQGNSKKSRFRHKSWGTDRGGEEAYNSGEVTWKHDVSHGVNDNQGCHRSDVAPIKSAKRLGLLRKYMIVAPRSGMPPVPRGRVTRAPMRSVPPAPRVALGARRSGQGGFAESRLADGELA